MLDHVKHEMDCTRQRINEAEIALDRATGLLEENSGVAVSVAVCCRVRSEQRRLAEARAVQARLLKISDK